MTPERAGCREILGIFEGAKEDKCKRPLTTLGRAA